MAKEHKTDNLILFIMALGAVIFHIALNGQYGFHRDELDFLMNARQLAWGYVLIHLSRHSLHASGWNCLASLCVDCASCPLLRRALP